MYYYVVEDINIYHPPHYTFKGIEPIDAIEEWGLNFSRGNIIKYIARAGKKGCELTDLKKAKFYLEREIKRTARAMMTP